MSPNRNGRWLRATYEISEKHIAMKRYRDERYKRKVSHVIRSRYHLFCPYGRSREKRYELWAAMKSVGWRAHCRRGWYDPVFIKKLQNARVRYVRSVPKGNGYRKIDSGSNRAGWEEWGNGTTAADLEVYAELVQGAGDCIH